jgi:hypothetical protein
MWSRPMRVAEAVPTARPRKSSPCQTPGQIGLQSLDVQAEARGDGESDDEGHQAAPVPSGHDDVELRAQHGLAPEEDREQDEAQPGEQAG